MTIFQPTDPSVHPIQQKCQPTFYHLPSWLSHIQCTIDRNTQCMYVVVPIQQDAFNLMESIYSSHLPILTGLAVLVNVFAYFPCLCNNRA